MTFSKRKFPFDLRRPLQMYLILALLDFLYQTQVRSMPWGAGFVTAVVEALAFGVVFMATTWGNLERLTLAYLALPYLLFLPLWLNLPTAIFMTGGMMVALGYAWKFTRPSPDAPVTTPDLSWQAFSAYLGILVWVHLSGSGGYGYQSSDYGLHNGRLLDLKDFTWPVRYGKDANLVYYVGYFLPGALIAKLFGLEIAVRSMLPWTVLGVTLVLRWLCHLTQQRLAPLIVLVFAFFGPMDLLGYVATKLESHTLAQAFTPAQFWEHTDSLDFWASSHFPHFLGNFLSTTFQLYWAPHQIIAGWLCAALSIHSFLHRRNEILIFGYALLCLWSPMAMLGFAPVLLIFALYNLRQDSWRSFLSVPNLFATLALAPLFLLFYAGGSALSNPHYGITSWLTAQNLRWFLLFHLFGWLLYAIGCASFIRQQQGRQKVVIMAVCLCFVVVSLLIYGTWSDLICRGSAPLGFCLAVIILNAWRQATQKKLLLPRLFLCLCLILGSTSAFLQLRLAIVHYGKTQPPVRSDQYVLSSQFLGPDGSLFGRLFRRPAP